MSQTAIGCKLVNAIRTRFILPGWLSQLAVTSIVLLASCTSTTEPTTPITEVTTVTAVPSPTPDIAATVAAAVAATQSAITTPTPVVLPEPTPTRTPIPVPSTAQIATPTPSPTPTRTPVPTASLTPENGDRILVEMIIAARPSVVRIQAGNSTGSGVIYRVDGTSQSAFVLTNQHVVEGHSSPIVWIEDRLSYPGIVRGTDATRDLAVIEICCSSSFLAVPFGSSSALKPGQVVVAMGYPLGITDSARVTTGVVSAVSADVPNLRTVIQTDAAINPGNSGGPLFNLAGEIVGINTFVIRSIGQVSVEGTGFAVAQETIATVLNLLQNAPAMPTPSIPSTPTAIPLPESNLLVGPINGELDHLTDSTRLRGFDTGVSLNDFKIEAEFENPFSPSVKVWNHGFTFRNVNGTFHLVIISGDGSWLHYTRTEKGDQLQGAGSYQAFLPGQAKNKMSLIVLNDQGYLFVNDSFVSVLDLSAISGEGAITLIQGVFPNDELTGSVTKFKDLKITRMNLEVDEETGFMVKAPGLIATSNRSITARNVVLTAEFLNPYAAFSGNWSFGFQLRKSPTGVQHYVIITDSKDWMHYHRANAGASAELIEFDDADALEVGADIYSKLTVVADGPTLYVFINDDLATRLEIPEHDLPGGNRMIAGFFSGDQPAGTRSEYRNFKIWEFDE